MLVKVYTKLVEAKLFINCNNEDYAKYSVWNYTSCHGQGGSHWFRTVRRKTVELKRVRQFLSQLTAGLACRNRPSSRRRPAGPTRGTSHLGGTKPPPGGTTHPSESPGPVFQGRSNSASQPTMGRHQSATRASAVTLLHHVDVTAAFAWGRWRESLSVFTFPTLIFPFLNVIIVGPNLVPLKEFHLK